VERDVRFEVPAPEVADAVSAAYHAKYDRHGPQIVGSVVGQHAAAVTVRLVPRQEGKGTDEWHRGCRTEMSEGGRPWLMNPREQNC
jgi:hypothetical protein